VSRLRILFVDHSLALGGAVRSLRGLIANYPDLDCDLVVPRLDRSMDDAAVSAFFGPNVRRVSREYLPFDLCYRGRPTGVAGFIQQATTAPPWFARRPGFYRMLRRERYDAIHLNSLVLHPMIRSELPFVIHVREIVDRHVKQVTANLENARGVIFIDEATHEPFRQARLNSVILNNPFDMTNVGTLPDDAAARIGGDPAKLTVFAIVGSLFAEKGVDRVIRAFRGATSPASRLLIVGNGPEETALRDLARGDSRIVFWGVDTQVERVFTLADHVLRGENYPCVGRTIYEALYAGCGVVIPGSETTHTLFEYERFAPRVRFYTPGDEGHLRARFDELAGSKFAEKRGESNVAEHVRGFDTFVRQAVGRSS
jgi:glycosyltransferase involved in cell wall biosynthesis